MRFFDILGRFINFKERVKFTFGLTTVDVATKFNTYHLDKQKLAVVLSNPAMLKVIALQCDLFSLGKISVVDEDGKPIENDPFLTLIQNPNPYQTQSQFLWDFMFWNMLGTAYCYVDSAVVEKKDNRLYFLNTSKMEWPQEMQKDADKLIFSSDTYNQQQKQQITYRYADGTSFKVPLSRLIITTDLTNGIGNWYKGPNRIDALYKIITNSEEALNAKNINVRYSGKFMVAGTQDPADTTRLPLGKDEKEDIESKMNGSKQVHALKSLIEIKRFVEDMKALQLDAAFMDDYYKMCLLYGIPKDVAEAYAKGSTWENQEKARMAHVTYSLEPKGNDLMNAFEKRFGYRDKKRNILMKWDHLPLAQVFEESKAKVKETKIKNLKELLSMGVPLEEANEFLDLKFTIEKPKPQENEQGQQGAGEENAAANGGQEQNQGGRANG